MIAGVAEPLDGIAGADALLGRPFPLPAAPLPLVRWVDVFPVGDGAEVAWALDDTRPGSPGRLALYAGRGPAPAREALAPAQVEEAEVGGRPARMRTMPLEEAQDSLRPVRELVWDDGELAYRLTAQGPWDVAALLAIAASIR
jgi:hypothetical protein